MEREMKQQRWYWGLTVMALVVIFPLAVAADGIRMIPYALDGGNVTLSIPDTATFNKTVGTGFDLSIDFIADTDEGVPTLMRFTERADPQTISVTNALVQFHSLHLRNPARTYIEDPPDGSTMLLVGRKETGVMNYESISRTDSRDVHYGEVFIVAACNRLFTFELFTRDGHSLSDSKIQGYYIQGIIGSVQFDKSCSS